MTWVINGTPELDDISRWRLIVGVTVACMSCMFLVLVLRIWVRWRLLKAVGWDDALLWFAAACSVVSGSLNITMSRLGLGLPATRRPAVNIDEYTKHNFVNRPMYVIASTCYKLSLCASYLRLIKKSGHKRYRALILAATFLAAGYGLSFLAAILFACSPIQKSWSPKTPGKCFKLPPFYYGTTSINLFVDVVILLIPIPLLWSLQMNMRRKLGLVLCFALGVFTNVGAVMRLVSTSKVIRFNDPDDFDMWSTVEINVGMITASIPALLPLLKKVRGGTKADTYPSRGTPLPIVRMGNLSASSGPARSHCRGHDTVDLEDMADDSDKSSQVRILHNGMESEGDLEADSGPLEINKTIDLRVDSSEALHGQSERFTEQYVLPRGLRRSGVGADDFGYRGAP